MSEEMILRHCSPTLAGMKTGSLFNCPCPDRQKLLCAVKELNRKLVPKGVRVIPLRTTKNKMLLYIYRPQKLKDDLSVSGAARLLQKYGYSVECTGKCSTAWKTPVRTKRFSARDRAFPWLPVGRCTRIY